MNRERRNQSGAADFTAYKAIRHADKEEGLKRLLEKIAEGRGFKIKLIRLEERKNK